MYEILIEICRTVSTFFIVATCLFTSLKSVIINNNFGTGAHSELPGTTNVEVKFKNFLFTTLIVCYKITIVTNYLNH